jgi:hypothetical protein
MNERYGALDILATVVSNVQEYMPVNKKGNLAEHRVSCHRCGNIRKRKLLCPRQSCPHIFCGRCADKMIEEHGEEVFAGGCPVCQELCCCSNKTVTCGRQNHCYRKCPSTKGKNGIKAEGGTGNDSDYHIRAPALEILAQVVSDRPNSPGNEVKKRRVMYPNSPQVASGPPDQQNVTKNTTTTPPPEQETPNSSNQTKFYTRSANSIIPIQPYSPDAASLSTTYAMSSLSALSAAAGNYDQYAQNMKGRPNREISASTPAISPSPSPTPRATSPTLQPKHDYSSLQPNEVETSKPAIPGNHIVSSSYHPQYIATAAALSDSSFESYAPTNSKSTRGNVSNSKSE